MPRRIADQGFTIIDSGKPLLVAPAAPRRWRIVGPAIVARASERITAPTRSVSAGNVRHTIAMRFFLLFTAAVLFAQSPAGQHDNYYSVNRDAQVGERLATQLQ